MEAFQTRPYSSTSGESIPATRPPLQKKLKSDITAPSACDWNTLVLLYSYPGFSLLPFDFRGIVAVGGCERDTVLIEIKFINSVFRLFF